MKKALWLFVISVIKNIEHINKLIPLLSAQDAMYLMALNLNLMMCKFIKWYVKNVNHYIKHIPK